jgi:endonuclease YncB( thermonuclease family)
MPLPAVRLSTCLRAGLAALLAWTALTAGATAAALTGQVTRVIDGDSVLFAPARGGPVLEVRLKDIDAPEGCQAGGEAARDFLHDLVRGRTVQLLTRGQDHYGRTLGVLQVDGVDLNQRLVAEGHAWALRSRGRPGPYTPQETMAQALKRGLHAERGAIPPGEFRRRHGPCGNRAPAVTAPRAATRVAPTGTAPRPAAPGALQLPRRRGSTT